MLRPLRSRSACALVQFFWTGDHGEDVTPVPISNTTVKGLRGDDTAYKSAGK